MPSLVEGTTPSRAPGTAISMTAQANEDGST